MRTLILLALTVGLVACGSSNPTTPTAPAPASWTLSGNVTSGGTGLVSATVTIADGPNAGRNVMTGANGAYQLAGLIQSGFTVTFSASGYVPVSRGVTLTANTTMNVDLTRLPFADLKNVPTTVNGIPQPDGSFALALTGVNSGTGCAGSIAGLTDLSNTAGFIKTVAWFLPPSTIVRPGEQFTYQVCCISHDQAFSPGGNYFTRFTFNTISCP